MQLVVLVRCIRNYSKFWHRIWLWLWILFHFGYSIVSLTVTALHNIHLIHLYKCLRENLNCLPLSTLVFSFSLFNRSTLREWKTILFAFYIYMDNNYFIGNAIETPLHEHQYVLVIGKFGIRQEREYLLKIKTGTTRLLHEITF